MNAAHVGASASATVMIAQVLVWLSHWPLSPLDDNTAMAIAGLLVIVLGGGGIVIANNRTKPPTS